MSFFDSKKTDNKSEANHATTDPWAPQAAALTDAFGKAQTAFGNASTAKAPTDFTAQFTPDQLNTFRSMIGQGANTAIPDANAATGAALGTAGTAGVQGALANLSGFDPTKNNGVDSTLAAANKYVAGQDIDAQVRNAMLQATQTARDVTMPGITQNAAGGNNQNSSRTAIAEGMVQRGLAQQSTDLGVTARDNAFARGLQLAQTQGQNNNAATIAAAQGAGSIGNNAANIGVNANNAALSNQTALNATAMAGGAGMQASDQANLTNQKQQFEGKIGAEYANLQQLMAIIGGKQWGSETNGTNTGTSTTTNSPSMASNLASVAGMAANLYTGGASGALSSAMGGMFQRNPFSSMPMAGRDF